MSTSFPWKEKLQCWPCLHLLSTFHYYYYYFFFFEIKFYSPTHCCWKHVCHSWILKHRTWKFAQKVPTCNLICMCIHIHSFLKKHVKIARKHESLTYFNSNLHFSVWFFMNLLCFLVAGLKGFISCVACWAHNTEWILVTSCSSTSSPHFTICI